MGVVGEGSRHFTGPGLGEITSWRCVQCGVENFGLIAQGCASCGSGSARAYRAPETAAPVGARVETSTSGLRRAQPAASTSGGMDVVFTDWLQTLGGEPPSPEDNQLLRIGFYAGYQAAMGKQLAEAPPVTSEVAQYAPETKAQRTIVAALRHFAEHVLHDATEEIAAGEWMSITEVHALIDQLEAQYQ